MYIDIQLHLLFQSYLNAEKICSFGWSLLSCIEDFANSPQLSIILCNFLHCAWTATASVILSSKPLICKVRSWGPSFMENITFPKLTIWVLLSSLYFFQTNNHHILYTIPSSLHFANKILYGSLSMSTGTLCNSKREWSDLYRLITRHSCDTTIDDF